ncbi:MAG TPA: hypothetical protein VNZ06_10570 [Steroidobacteraceae bacterium]|jgi:hypothetical protein|nr:hypothetical protein [Steroidobacteraceae bacterium]
MRRFDRSAKLKDPLRLISCGNCQRLMDFMDRPGHPPPATDPDKLHPIFLKNPPAYSVLCTCGHYTFYVDEADRAHYEAKYFKSDRASAGSPAGDEPASR